MHTRRPILFFSVLKPDMSRTISRKIFPTGSIYRDTSSRGSGQTKRDTWRAEISYANVRLRKRAASKRELSRWLKKTALLIKTRALALPDEASVNNYQKMMLAVRKEISLESFSSPRDSQ